MTDEELEQIADELGDVQQIIAYLLFRRSRPTLSRQVEHPTLINLAQRLRVVANRLEPTPIGLHEEQSHGRQLPIGRS